MGWYFCNFAPRVGIWIGTIYEWWDYECRQWIQAARLTHHISSRYDRSQPRAREVEICGESSLIQTRSDSWKYQLDEYQGYRIDSHILCVEVCCVQLQYRSRPSTKSAEVVKNFLPTRNTSALTDNERSQRTNTNRKHVCLALVDVAISPSARALQV